MRGAGKQALVCSYHAPQADRDSGARRIVHFIDFLQAEGWAVTFLASDGIGEVRAARALERRGVAVFDGWRGRVETLLESSGFDLALIAFWSNAERYLPVLREVSAATRVVVDSVDLHFLREARSLFHRGPTPARAHGLDAGYGSRLVRELNTYAAADGVLTVSAKEADLVTDLIHGATPVYAVSDSEELRASTVPFGRRRGVLSVGSFQHRPNVDAVEYLCKEIVPRLPASLLVKHPLYVVGNELNESVRAFARGLDHVRMVGWVPAVEPYFEQCRISVVPLRYGAGTKRKLIQSMMTGTPAVSTSIGVEGLGALHGEHVLVADDAESFAASIARLLTDARLWRKIARAGRAHVLEAHSHAAARSRLMAAVDAVLDGAAKGVDWIAPDRRARPHTAKEEYAQLLVPRIREIVGASVPPGATVVVVSRGDEDLMRLDGVRAWHFPRLPNGTYAGHHPADSADAVAKLEAVRTQGGDYLVLPRTSFWWLEHYDGFKEHLESRYRRVVDDPDACRIYELDPRLAIADTEPPLAPDETPDVKLIALYLPQFHPIPENDAWWGEGFTEWRSVAKAEPLFPGHYQPHLPADLGFYDLRLAETRSEQVGLARAHGIHGFCWYHYWFHGKRLLERPFDEVLESGEPDFPFCLCWANDPWSRRWDGREDELLQAQTYSAEDDIAHIRSLLPAFADPRAIRIDGKPIFLVYRGQHLPDAASTTDRWRREVHRAGLPGIYLIAVETAWDLGWDATQVGFDAKVLFQPQFGKLLTSVPRTRIAGKADLQVYDYREAWQVLGDLAPVTYRRYDCVFPGWDNSARVGERAVVLHDTSPAEYEKVLARAIARVRPETPEHRVVFINAWNEWAEGCHLEPDARNGHAFLQATLRALRAGAPARRISATAALAAGQAEARSWST